MTHPDLLSWAEAQRKADEGMQRAVDHADSVDPKWSERAQAELQLYCLSYDNCEFTAEEVRAELHKAGLPYPPDGRAWGSVFKVAARLGWIHKIGYAPRKCGNMTPTIIWATVQEGHICPLDASSRGGT